MKRLIALILCAVMLMGLCAVPGLASEEPVPEEAPAREAEAPAEEPVPVPAADGDFDKEDGPPGYTMSGTEMTVTNWMLSISGADKQIVTACVIEPGAEAIAINYFWNCPKLRAVQIPDTVKSIGARAFCDCTELESIVIPNSVTSLGERAFSNCQKLTDVTLSSSLTSLPEEVFSNCYWLNSIVIPEGIETLEHMSFYACTGLKTVYLPVSLKTVGSGAFESAASGIVFHYAGTNAQWDQVTIEDYNDGITEGTIVFDGNAATIPADALGGGTVEASGLTWFVAKDGVLHITGRGDMPDFQIDESGGKITVGTPWYGLQEKIVKIAVAEGITAVGNNAFWGLETVTEVTLPEGITRLGDQAFFACQKLGHIDLPSTLTSIGSQTFMWCPFEEIAFPAGLKSIGASAFDMNELKSIVLPEGIESIGAAAFSPNEKVTALTIPAGLREFGTTDGTDGPFTALYALESIRVSEGVKTIPARCFSHCFAVKTIGLPSTIDTLGHDFILLTVDGEDTTAKLESITVAPREGYTFAGWEDADGRTFTSEEIVSRTAYTGDLKAIWLKDFSEDTFTDVKERDWFYEYVKTVDQRGLIVGMTDNTFGPNHTGTRAQVVTILYRLAGEPEIKSTCPFSDVPENEWYTSAVTWAAVNWITAGYEDGTFRPNRQGTRQEFVVFLMNMADYLGVPVRGDPWEDSWTADFPDAGDISTWARAAENWSVGVGLQSGSADSSGQAWLKPKDSVTRAQLATYLAIFCSDLNGIRAQCAAHVAKNAQAAQ